MNEYQSAYLVEERLQQKMAGNHPHAADAVKIEGINPSPFYLKKLNHIQYKVCHIHTNCKDLYREHQNLTIAVRTRNKIIDIQLPYITLLNK